MKKVLLGTLLLCTLKISTTTTSSSAADRKIASAQTPGGEVIEVDNRLGWTLFGDDDYQKSGIITYLEEHPQFINARKGSTSLLGSLLMDYRDNRIRVINYLLKQKVNTLATNSTGQLPLEEGLRKISHEHSAYDYRDEVTQTYQSLVLLMLEQGAPPRYH